MHIGIIGSGIVGRVLGSAFLAEGHQVTLGTRDIQKQEVQDWAAANPKGHVATFSDTAAAADLIVVATGGMVTLDAIALTGPDHFKGKVVIDATNPIDSKPPVNGVLQFFTGPNDSLLERIQAALPEAKVVKAFSCVGNALMYKPALSATPTMFICGNDADAKQTVTGILTSFGWETMDLGHAEAARAIEPLSMLWCIPGILKGDWKHAFKMVW